MKKLMTYCSALTLLFLAACGGEIPPGQTDMEKTILKGLPFHEVTVSTSADSGALVATVESSERALLTARTDGHLLRLAAREGSLVKKGELLATIGDNAAGRKLQEAEGALGMATARLELAEKTFDRYQKLSAKEAVTPQELDQIAADLRVAQDGRAAAAAAVEAARIAAAHTRIAAPYDGRVLRHLVEEGSTILPGTPLLELEGLGAWRVRVEVPESYRGRFVPGTPVRVEIPSLSRQLEGTVTEVLAAADPQSRTFQVKAALGAGEGLTSGMFARVFVPGAERTSLFIPRSALLQRGQLAGVYVLEDGILHYRLVKTGRQVADRVEILSGLRAGERILADKVDKASHGDRVEEER
ncbi:MAG: efflux RND transporter periplasmic adaptor subunit [Desulfuromonadales bacterium]|nr:efflux RND transporter periplasmic adaptor subunit [Desulfuromonadales bacterium]MDW7758464.1 efflux RND transporter periplasmic adaptor subunit [Desulfuromonadales bacterium]